MAFKPSDLRVIVPFTNPCGWHARIKNMRAAEDGILAAGASLTTIELVHRDRAFVLPDRDGVQRIRVRGDDVLWHKENQIDLAVAQTSEPHLAFLDGDILFFNAGWPVATLDLLQIHPAVQITSGLVYTGPGGQDIGHFSSYMALYQQKRARIRSLDPAKFDITVPILLDRHGYPGGAWGWRRDAFEAVGGLPDFCVIGAGDQHVAWGLTETPDRLIEPANATEGYARAVTAWRERCARVIRRDVGLVPGMGMHLWHGTQADRKYPDRWRILQNNQFDPATDLECDRNGVIKLAGNKPDLRDDIRAYFLERSEDTTLVPPNEPAAASPTPGHHGWYPPHHHHPHPHHPPRPPYQPPPHHEPWWEWIEFWNW